MNFQLSKLKKTAGLAPIGKQAETSAPAEIAELCVIAGCAERFAEFINGRKTPAEVRAALVASQGNAKPWGEVLGSLGLKQN